MSLRLSALKALSLAGASLFYVPQGSFESASAQNPKASAKSQLSPYSTEYILAVRKAVAAGRKVFLLAVRNESQDALYKDAFAQAKIEIQGALGFPRGHVGLNGHLLVATVQMELGQAQLVLAELNSSHRDGISKAWDPVNQHLRKAEQILASLEEPKSHQANESPIPIFRGLVPIDDVDQEPESADLAKLGINLSSIQQTVLHEVSSAQQTVIEFYRKQLQGFSETQVECGQNTCIVFKRYLGDSVSAVVQIRPHGDRTRVRIGKVADVVHGLEELWLHTLAILSGIMNRCWSSGARPAAT